MNRLLKISIITLLSFNLYAYNINNNINYTIQLQQLKKDKIQQALLLKQYLHDLEVFNNILKQLYINRSFRFATTTAELTIKNKNSLYTIDYIKALLKILNGKNLNKKGYIKYIKDLYNNNYKMYLYNYPADEVILKNFDYIYNKINKDLVFLENNLNNNKNVRPILKDIFNNLIDLFEELKKETIQLKKTGIIQNFNNKIIDEYDLDESWAQPNSNLQDILNFIENGDVKYNIKGIKDYYNIYNLDKPFVISF